MAKYLGCGLTFGLSFFALACGSDSGDSPAPAYDAGPSASGASVDSGSASGSVDSGAISTALDAGSTVTPTRDSGATTAIDSGATTALDSGSTSATDSGSNTTGDSGGSDAASAGATSLTGTYGSLGAVKPVVSSLWISTGLETILYLSSAPLTCELVMMEGGKWLLQQPAGSQVLEIVVRGTAKVGTVKVPPGEANYAQGGMSSATEKTASSGTLMFTKAEAKGVIEGSVMATYSSGNVSGTFHAEFCQGGQEW